MLTNITASMPPPSSYTPVSDESARVWHNKEKARPRDGLRLRLYARVGEADNFVRAVGRQLTVLRLNEFFGGDLSLLLE